MPSFMVAPGRTRGDPPVVLVSIQFTILFHYEWHVSQHERTGHACLSYSFQ
jgi:hypothetical protein